MGFRRSSVISSPSDSRSPLLGRSSAATPSPSRSPFCATLLDDSVSSAHSLISKWTGPASSAAASLFRHGRSDAAAFLRAASDLHRAMLFSAASTASSSASLARAQSLLQSAMARLDLELRLLLSSLPAPFSPSETDADAAADDIAAVAGAMVAAGYGAECVKAFRSLRRAAVGDALARLLGPDAHDQKLEPGLLDLRARSWLAAAPAAVRRLFAGERALCDRVFAAPDAAAIRDPIFADVAGAAAARLLSFPGAAAARARRCPEKLFAILDLYDALSDLRPEIDSLFPSSSAAAAAGDSLLRLAEAARSLIGDFEAAIQGEASRSPVPGGGGVHPMTRYVMNYLVFLADYDATLADIYADLPLQIPTPLPDSIFDSSSISSPSPSPSPSSYSEDNTLSARMAWLILVLLCKLDKKAECYREVSLSYLFLANNVKYIANKVKESRLGDMLGEEWVARHSAKARRYAESYERAGWGPVAAAIPAATGTAAEAAERMRQFNAAAEAALQAQEGAVVADEAMRAAIRADVTGMVVPAYRAFYWRCREVMGPAEAAAVVRFTPEDVRDWLAELFSGQVGLGSGSGSGSASSHSSGSGSVRILVETKGVL